jgi:hypothetical protein
MKSPACHRGARRGLWAAGALALLAALGLAGCGSEPTDEAEQILADLQAQGYRSFARAPGWETPRLPSTGHHGNFVDIYINDVMEAAVDAGWPAGPAPEGAVIVKDGWSDPEGEILHQIAVMKKGEGGEEWFYAEYTGNGKSLEAGEDYEECLGCHAAGHDYVLAF